MGLGLLPWEKWLPPYIFGPLLFVGSILILVVSSGLAWWEYVLLPSSAALGAWSTWAWFKHGRNVFKDEEKSNSESPGGVHSTPRDDA
jgi:hypothetical protein